MTIKEKAANYTVIAEGEKELVFSYATLVAVKKNNEVHITDKKYSVTTSKHINKYLDGLTNYKKTSPEELLKL